MMQRGIKEFHAVNNDDDEILPVLNNGLRLLQLAGSIFVPVPTSKSDLSLIWYDRVLNFLDCEASKKT